MKSDYLSTPDTNEIEISLFGTGDGESVLVHIGKGNWIIIDSCQSHSNMRPMPLKYLQNIHVDIEKKVKLIIISHFHNDHIKGMKEIIEACPNTEVVIPEAFKSEDFNQLIELVNSTYDSTISGLGNEVIRNTLNKIDKDRINFVGIDTLILNESVGDSITCEVFCLSPTRKAKNRSIETFARIFQEKSIRPDRLPNIEPNENAIVLWIQFNDETKILLGSDLEEKSPTSGWTQILKKSKKINKNNTVNTFKLPHHGSKDGHCEEVWEKLLTDNPYIIFTGKNSSAIPTEDYINQVLSKSSNVFLSGSKIIKTKYQNRFLKRQMAVRTRKIRDIPKKCGHIRMRKSLQHSSDSWDVELFNDAIKLGQH